MRRTHSFDIDQQDLDSGASLIEILISIAILGTVGLAVLTGLNAAVTGSRIERDHSRAHEWLQSATEILVNDIDWVDCTTTDPVSLAAFYENELRLRQEIMPPGWKNPSNVNRLQIPFPVEYPDNGGTYGGPCIAEENRQKITIQVSNPQGEIIETVEVVKIP
jgi:type II secretory pathway pseudopilin PulG